MFKQLKRQLFSIFAATSRDVDFIVAARKLDESLTVRALNDLYETFTIAREHDRLH